jgi:hypothetical protein
VKRPAFQFYPGDWRNNAKLRRCSHAARGAWIDVLCLFHDADEYGVLRWPLADIANAAAVPMKLLRELVDKGVLKGADRNGEPYVWAPTHAGRKGTAVVLVPASVGPCWYCSRFVRDEYVRERRGANTRFAPNEAPNHEPKGTPKQGIGERQGYGASTASSSSSLHGSSVATPPPAAGPADRVGQFECHDHPEATPNPVAPFAIALNRLGFRCTSMTPDLVAYQREGGTVEHLTECAGLPDCTGKPAAYAIRIARRELTERAPTITGATHEPARARSSGRLSAVEQVEHAIAQRQQREAAAGRTFDA